ncbi:MAG: nitrate- and nitrite sensing domain-containing protein [Labedaea sp.]
MRARQSRRRVTAISTQVLLIALVPSIAVVLVGAALSAYLVYQGRQVSGFADDARGALEPISRFVTGVQEERRLTMRPANQSQAGPADLDAQRRRVDETLAVLNRTSDELASGASEDLRGTLAELARSTDGLPAVRQQIDSGVLDPWHAYHSYDDLLDLCGAVIQGIARSAADAAVGFEQMISYDLYKSAEAMSRSHAMAVRAVVSGVDGTQFHELAHQLGMYHEQVESVVPRLTPRERDTYAALKGTPAWAALVAGDNALMFRGPTFTQPTFDVPAWESSARQVGTALMGLYVSHSQYAASLATARGDHTFQISMLAGAAILIIVLLAIVIALRLSRGMVRRLRGLRRETLDVARNGLPELVTRIQQGKSVDLRKPTSLLDYGTDEVGQVADAFNNAQRTAIAAAVREAETRQGVRAVFLNIARRSQVIVHRQLGVLDRAERAVEDPEQLQVLFQLDHLATRARRNAENLIILAGEQPGRQWRNPVSLRDVVRSAVAETEQYTRVKVTSLPDVAVVGTAVADIVHLLAELVDNGTAFSPKESTVEVRASQVRRGVVVEIEDNGLGIEPDRLGELNAMLQHPPGFDMMALGTESRVGLFVVARLADRHEIKVALRDSDFGGTRAVVLIPQSRVVTPEQPAEPAPVPDSVAPRPRSPLRDRTRIVGGTVAKPPLPRRHRQANLAPQLLTGEPGGEHDGAVWPGGDEPPQPERSRRSMSAFQQGTRQGRGVDPGNSGSNGSSGSNGNSGSSGSNGRQADRNW